MFVMMIAIMADRMKSLHADHDPCMPVNQTQRLCHLRIAMDGFGTTIEYKEHTQFIIGSV